MISLDDVRGWLNENFGRLASVHDVPGATVAVLAGGEIAEAAAGKLNRNTGVDATTDSVFQIGSITKLWTTTLIMQLVDEGMLELDAPVRTYLPEFRVSDEQTSARVTVRHLLTHTSGFEGDVFRTTTRDDDAVERLVTDVLPSIAQHVPMGTLFSSNNAGFATLGRIVEVLRSMPWAAALREYLIEPLGLTHVASRADEAILFRAAVGHLRTGAGGQLEPTPIWALQHSGAPAGAMLAMTARSVLSLAQLYLADGVTADGVRLLTSESIARMWQPCVDLPPLGIRAQQWGLGWALYGWDADVVGHDGGTIGQSSFFRMAPSAGVAVALLTNGGGSTRLYQDVCSYVFDALASIELPPLPKPPADPQPVTDASRYIGTYEHAIERMDVSVDGSELVMRSTPKGELSELMKRMPEETRLVRLDGETFVSVEPKEGTHPVFAFVGSDSAGRAQYLHNSRAIPRIH